MTYLRQRYLKVRALWLCLGFALPVMAGGAHDGKVEISFQVKDSVVRTYQPVYVTLSILNRHEEEIEIDLGTNGKASIEFRIFDGSGSLVKAARLEPEKALSVPGDLVVREGERFTARYLLNEWHTFSSSGKYRIEGRILNPVEAEGPQPVTTELRGSMHLEVLPSDPAHLQELGNDLAQRAIQPSSFLEGQEAVFTLSQIKDPIVVPFLHKVVEKAPFRRDLAIQALGRIGTRDAIEVLISLASDPNAGDRKLAAFTLWKLQIAIGEKDPELLKKVQEAIRPFFGGAGQR